MQQFLLVNKLAPTVESFYVRHHCPPLCLLEILPYILPPPPSTTLLLPRSPIQYIIIDPEINTSHTRTLVLRTSPSKPESSTLQSKQKNKFATFESNRKEIDKKRSDGFIGKKNRLKTKGKFEVGGKKEIKVSDNRTADTFVVDKGELTSMVE